MTENRVLPLLAALLAAAVGCAGPSAGADPPTVRTPAAGPAAAGAPATGAPDADRAFSTDDIRFLVEMLGHHAISQQLVELAGRRADAAGVRAFAAATGAAQQRDIDRMTQWLAALGVDPDTAGGGHDHGGGPTAQDVADLGELSGTAFDRRFLDLLAAHSVGATALADAEAKDGFNTGARRLAAEIAQREFDDLATIRHLL